MAIHVTGPVTVVADRDRQVRRNTTRLALGQGLAATTFSVLLIVGSVAAADMTGRDSVVGVMNGSYFVAAAVGAVLFGRGMDRYGRRPGLAVAYLVLGSAGVVCAVGIAASSFALLLAGTLVFGLAFGGTNLARAAVADMYGPERRGRAVGLVLAAGTVGAIGSPFLVAFLRSWGEREGLNPDVVPWVLVPTAAIGALACALSLRPDPRDLSIRMEGDPVAGPSRRPRELLAVPRIRMAVVAVAVGQMAMVAVMGITPIALDHHHASTAVVSTVISLHVAGMWAFAPVIGAALDRYGRTPGLLVGGITSLVGAALCAADRPGVIAVGLFAIGLGWSATFLGATAVISDLTEPSERAGALGFSDLVVSGSSAVAGFVSGVVFDAAGFRVLGIGVAALVLLAILSVARWRGPAAVAAERGS
jgi:MFS family permease